MNYLDANFFIFLFYPTDSQEYRNAVETADGLLKSEEQLVTSTLTWDEVTYWLLDEHGREIAEKQAEKLLSFPHLHFAPVGKSTLSLAKDLFKQGLKPRDAIHAACALENNCKKMFSNDECFDKVKGLKRIPI